MDLGSMVAVEILPLIRTYKDGRIERLNGTDVIPPSVDPVASKDVFIDPSLGLTARVYLPNRTPLSQKIPVLVYYHGGGFCIESPFSPLYHPYLNSLVLRSNVLAVSVDYRLAPEHPIPAAYDDSWRALTWVLSGGDDWLEMHGDLERVFLAGDSAGANIVHNIGMRAGGAGIRLAGMALVHPYFWGRERIGLEAADENDGFITLTTVDAVWPFVCDRAVENEEHDDPRLNPLAAGAPSLAGLVCQRVMVEVAGRDVLRERGRAYISALRGSGWGGMLEAVVVEGEGHVFHLFSPGTENARQMMDRLVEFLNPTSA